MKKDSYHPAIHFYLAVLVIFAYPFSIPLCSVSIVLWALHWGWMSFVGFTHKPKWPWLLLLISFPVMVVISLTYSENLDYGFFSVEKRISLFLIPVIISTGPGWDRDTRDRFFFYAYISALLAALTCLAIAASTYFKDGTNNFFWSALTQPFRFHPGYFSFFIVVLIFWFLNELIRSWNLRSRNYKLFAILSVLFLAGFLILLAARVQLLLFYGTLLILSIIYLRRLNLKMKVALLLFLAASFYLIGNSFIRERINNISTFSYKLNDPPQTFNELTIRLALIECSWDVIQYHWPAGVGIGDSYDELEKVYRKYDYQFGYGDKQDPHNEYLNTLVGTGLAGLILLLCNFGLSFYLAIQRRDLVHFLFILFFVIGCLFESMLSQQKGIVLFSLFNSIFIFKGCVQPENRAGA